MTKLSDMSEQNTETSNQPVDTWFDVSVFCSDISLSLVIKINSYYLDKVLRYLHNASSIGTCY
jgi:hypothetical protein